MVWCFCSIAWTKEAGFTALTADHNSVLGFLEMLLAFSLLDGRHREKTSLKDRQNCGKRPLHRKRENGKVGSGRGSGPQQLLTNSQDRRNIDFLKNRQHAKKNYGNWELQKKLKPKRVGGN